MTCPQDEDGRWIVHGERPIYENKWVTVGFVDISQPSGDRFEHHTVTLPPAAMTIVLDDTAEHVLMSWRHRFVPDVWNWELPGVYSTKARVPPRRPPARSRRRPGTGRDPSSTSSRSSPWLARSAARITSTSPAARNGLPTRARSTRGLPVGGAGRGSRSDREGSDRELRFPGRAPSRPRLLPAAGVRR